MFGMLDYRAYKLFWLIGLPLRIISRLSFFVIVAAAIFIAQQMEYPPIVKMGIAYVAMELMLIVFIIVWMFLIGWPIEKAFFWFIDVIPSKGADIHETKEIVRRGPLPWLLKKMDNDIDNWTLEDHDEFIKCLNWRARLLFNAKNRVWERVKASACSRRVPPTAPQCWRVSLPTI